jgi:hypothetical protein
LAETVQLVPGAVAILDALGFKGIWKRHKINSIVAKLKSINQLCVTVEKHWGKTLEIPALHSVDDGPAEKVVMQFKQPKLFVRLLSDSIVVGSQAASRKDEDVSDALWNVARVCAAITFWGRRSPKPILLYRGAISCGDFLIDSNFLIGPAIDEAAQLHQLGQAACVWFAPSACKLLQGYKGSIPGAREPEKAATLWFHQAVDGISVPLKDGRSLQTWMLVPFHGDFDRERADILDAFGRAPLPLDVLLKQQATAQCIDACAARVIDLVSGTPGNDGPIDSWGNANLVMIKDLKPNSKRRVRTARDASKPT